MCQPLFDVCRQCITVSCVVATNLSSASSLSTHPHPQPPAPNLLPSNTLAHTHKHTLPIWSSWRPKATKAAGPIPRAEGEGPHSLLGVCVCECMCCVCVCVSIHRVLEGSSPGQTAISSFLSVLAAACVVVCVIVPTDCIPCELQGQQQRTVGPPSTGQGCSRVHKYELLHPVKTEPFCGGFYHLVKSNYPYRNRKYFSQL